MATSSKSIAAGLSLLICLAAARPSIGQEAREAGADDAAAAGPSSVNVIPIEHAVAAEVADVIRRVVRNAFVTPDERTNALIVTGSNDSLAAVRDLVARLDVDVEDADTTLRVFQLQRATADDRLAAVLSSVLQRVGEAPSVRIASDLSTNQIIARGETESLTLLERLIQSLDRPAVDGSVSGEMQLRFVWLVSGLDEKQSAAVPADLAEVVTELQRLGIDNLRTAAQSIVRMSVNQSFSAQFTASVGDPWATSIGGFVRPGSDGRRELHIEIEGHQQNGPGAAEVDTAISVTPGHFVVLGATPILSRNSVFVIQLTDLQ